MPKVAFTPLRKAEIIGLADAARKKYAGLSIDQIAERENIILIREPSANSKKAGYACSLKSETPKLIPSLSRSAGRPFLFSVTDFCPIENL